MPLQTPLAQSVPTRHFLLVAHPGQLGPPQSLSVSFPFSWLSLQVAVEQWNVMGSQTVLVQSASTAHTLLLAHVGHTPPPQLRSVSSPLVAASAQVGTWQTPVVHTPLTQSAAITQFF